jgi:hypothetical protein
LTIRCQLALIQIILVLLFIRSSVLEELSVRSNIALAQKKFVNEIELSYDAKCDGNELEKEYNKLSKQVVST